jgi:putative RNA 2'-phosphotransferase
MRRQHVHLSIDVATARQVGRRRTPHPVVLVVRAGEAHAAGVAFYEGNAAVWLAEHVPPAFIDTLEGQDVSLAAG